MGCLIIALALYRWGWVMLERRTILDTIAGWLTCLYASIAVGCGIWSITHL